MRDELVEVDSPHKVCDGNDDPGEEPTLLDRADLRGRHVINVRRRNQFAMLAVHLS